MYSFYYAFLYIVNERDYFKKISLSCSLYKIISLVSVILIQAPLSFILLRKSERGRGTLGETKRAGEGRRKEASKIKRDIRKN